MIVPAASSPAPAPTDHFVNLRQVREAFGATQGQLARAAGLPVATIRRAELGCEIAARDAQAIVAAFNVNGRVVAEYRNPGQQGVA